jgi:hypothetical protein
MRTAFSVLILIGAMVTPAAAHSPLPPGAPVPRNLASEPAPSHIDLPSADSFLYRHARREDAEGLTLDGAHMSAPPPSGSSGPSFNIGAFHAEIGGTGTHAHLAHYTLEGVQVMGGSVSGSIYGKSARLNIDW